MIVGNSCWICARNYKRSRECSRMRASSRLVLSFLLSFLSFSLFSPSFFLFLPARMHRRVRVLECRRRRCNKKKTIRFHRRGGGETRRESSRRRRKGSTRRIEPLERGRSEEEGESVKGSECKGVRKGKREGDCSSDQL